MTITSPVVINGISWEPNPDCKKLYLFDYERMFADIAKDRKKLELPRYRYLCQNDLWFLVYFVLGVTVANHPFWVEACYEIQHGPKSHTLDLWARGHGKSSCITTCETVQRILNDPEQRVCIFSWKNAAALTFFRQIKLLFEQSEFLKFLFPDILYKNPLKDAPKWSEDAGIYVKRRGSYKEPTLMAAGLVEAMPTGMHFTGRVYDDIMTDDFASNPEQIEKVKVAFDMSGNLGTLQPSDWVRVIGTPYHHDDVLAYIKDQKDDKSEPLWHTRYKPATENGEPNGKSVYLPESELARLRLNKRLFNSQQLLNPTPAGTQKLDFKLLKKISKDDLPPKLYKFMAIDPAGWRTTRTERQDSWAIYVVGVEPIRDDIGASNTYILDMCIEEMKEDEAITKVVEMYMLGGRILSLGVEKVGMQTTEVHIANALRAKGRVVTLENGGLVLLRPAGRSKSLRIEQNLMWPLNNGKVHYLDTIPAAYTERLRMEMERFPFWHDDGLDGLSYVWDLLKDYNFPAYDANSSRSEESWDAYFAKQKKDKPGGWLVA